ncbi:MAG: sensor histidine kinase [Gammaproteobacteria bacterium]|nr:sensor histidine kinase [Gammaproteobacteria bacterium]MBV8307633.1 sensor histidine kinase [Gammaproteobacteria bacterium]MBV8402711.1 sensor histidine kinase [Gammaproteobacteria bacterium]
MTTERERGTQPTDVLSDTQRVRASIARAKFEWETTVDALPDLIGLLDSAGRVMRVNRVVERWNLGSITNVLGRDLHGLLHDECAAEACALKAALESAESAARSGEVREFELRDAMLGRALSVTLRPMTSVGEEAVGTDCFAVAIVADVTALHLAREALHALNAELEMRVRLRTDELADANRDLQNEIMRRAAAEQALRRSRNELELLSRQQIATQENERKRIARELHDSVGQQLSAIKYSLERIELALEARIPEAQRQVLRRAVTGLQDVLEELRGIAMNLRPAVLDDLGAASAVSWFCREFAQSYPALQLQEAVSVRDVDVPERLGTAVFRSVQELLNNVAKHSQAHKVMVSLSRRVDRLVLEVNDDGVGLGRNPSPPALRSGRGIHNLRERAEMTGGQFTLSSGDSGVGSHARIEWHLAAAESTKPDGPEVAWRAAD